MIDWRRRNAYTEGPAGLEPDQDGLYKLTGLHQSWQRRVVLNVPELNLQEGRRYALLGANGAGKSTLLRLLADRLGQPDGRTAYLPQKPYAFSMSVQNNVGLGIPTHLGLDRPQRQEAIRNQLDRLGLAGLSEARGNRLSGGEAQRMSLARLMVVPRRILLLDEPGGSLDLNSMAQAEEVLADYLAENRCPPGYGYPPDQPGSTDLRRADLPGSRRNAGRPGLGASAGTTGTGPAAPVSPIWGTGRGGDGACCMSAP